MEISPSHLIAKIACSLNQILTDITLNVILPEIVDVVNNKLYIFWEFFSAV